MCSRESNACVCIWRHCRWLRPRAVDSIALDLGDRRRRIGSGVLRRSLGTRRGLGGATSSLRLWSWYPVRARTCAPTRETSRPMPDAAAAQTSACLQGPIRPLSMFVREEQN